MDLEEDWSVYAVHWKSSRGESCNPEDLDFARRREDQAAGLVLDATDALADGRTVVVAGDYNVQAPGRVLRVGTSPGEDCEPHGSCEGVCGGDALDGYDDSVRMLLSMDPGARLLSSDLPATFVSGSFPGGAIDHIAVAGPRADSFEVASVPDVSGNRYHGSDHRPVFTTHRADLAPEGETPRDRLERLIEEVRERLDEIDSIADGL